MLVATAARTMLTGRDLNRDLSFDLPKNEKGKNDRKGEGLIYCSTLFEYVSQSRIQAKVDFDLAKWTLASILLVACLTWPPVPYLVIFNMNPSHPNAKSLQIRPLNSLTK